MFLLWLTACIHADQPMDPKDTTEVVFEVPKGASARSIGPRLAKQGFIPGEFQWKLYSRNQDLSCLKAGKHRLSRSMSMNDIAKTLCGAPIPEDEPFTVIEGWRIRDIDEALAVKGWIKPGEYISLAESKGVDLPFDVESPTLEGYLYPETYMVTPDRFSAKRFIERQLNTFDERFLATHKDKLEPRGLHAVVVMASMLEREEPKVSVRPTVAGILWKRIDHKWNLGVDATSRYTLDEWNDRKAFLKKLRDPDDPYNTRLRGGLPPTAIGNPSSESLESALSPVDSQWWYYLHDSSQTFHGAKNAAGHEANRRKYGVW